MLYTLQSVNIVSRIAMCLQDLSEPLNYDDISIVCIAIQTLIQLCTGNYANQEALFRASIVDTTKSILGQEPSADVLEKVSQLWWSI